MSLAVREVSVAKGYDPRDFALVASGGAGPLHVCAIARELYIPTVIVPLFPSHFSALGMLLADERHDFTRTVYSDLASVDFAKLVAVHDEMVEGRQGQPAPRQERAATRSISTCATWARSSRCRCRSRSTSSRSGERKAIRTAFDELYEQRYAHHSPDEPVEMVNIRLGAIGKRPKLSFPSLASAGAAQRRRRTRRRISARRKAAHRQGLSPRGSGRGRRDRRAGADPGARHHHGAVRERPAGGDRRVIITIGAVMFRALRTGSPPPWGRSGGGVTLELSPSQPSPQGGRERQPAANGAR